MFSQPSLPHYSPSSLGLHKVAAPAGIRFEQRKDGLNHNLSQKYLQNFLARKAVALRVLSFF